MPFTPEQEAFLTTFANAGLADQQAAQAANTQQAQDAEALAAKLAARQAIIDTAQAQLAAFDAANALTGQVTLVLTS